MSVQKNTIAKAPGTENRKPEFKFKCHSSKAGVGAILQQKLYKGNNGKFTRITLHG